MPTAVSVETESPEDDRMPLLSRVVGWLDIVLIDKCPKPIPMVVQLGVHANQPGIARVRPAVSRRPKPACDRAHRSVHDRGDDGGRGRRLHSVVFRLVDPGVAPPAGPARSRA